MKKHLKKLVSITLAVVMVITVFSIMPLTVSAAGNSFSSATNISMGVTYYGTITQNDNYDYYKFTLSSSGKVSISAITDFSGSFYIYNASQNYVWDSSNSLINEDIYLVSGTYYLRVNSYYSGNYNFKFTFSSANESFAETQTQNNDSFAKANSISMGTKYYGQIAETENSDYYKFTLSSSGKITISAKTDFSASFYIYNSSQNHVWDSSNSLINEDIYLVSGTYYLRVNSYYSGNYNFKFTFSSANESFAETQTQNNDSFAKANSISLGTRYYGQIAETENSDYYKFTLSSSGKITISAKTDFSASFYIYNSSQNYVWDSSNSLINEDIYITSGTYYLRVNSYYSGNYNFSISKQLPSPTSIKLNRGTLGLGVGENYGLVKTVSPSSANQSVTWTSSNTSVATVSSTGNVIGKKAGTATVTVKTSNGKTAKCTVTVKAAPSSIKISHPTVKLGQGERFMVWETTNAGSYANAANLRWTTTTIASVIKQQGTNKALIKAHYAVFGECSYSVTTYNKKTAYGKIYVFDEPSSVKLSASSITLNKGKTYTISESTNSGSYANAANLKWSSTNTKVATVTKGSGNKATIKAVAKGTAYVKITLYNGKTAQCKVTVK